MLEIIEPGPQTTIQDYPGRAGLQWRGLFPAGPVDHLAFRLANVLVGNEPGAAGLEIAMGRFAARARFAGVVAFCGAGSPAVNGAAVPRWEAVEVSPGDVLASTAAGPGFRLYLAVSGGIDVPPVLGSRSLHTMGGIGGLDGRALIRGDLLPVGPARERRLRVPQSLRPVYHHDWEIEVVRGPQADPEFLTAADWREFTSARWRVNLNSDRLGVLLNPHDFGWAREDGGLAGDHPSNVLDASYPLGGVIVNGDVPTILGPDGPSSGGFTVIATVVHAALWKVGQLRPGQDTVRFREVSPEEADSLAAHTEFVLEPAQLERI
ncbi:5-oxoprolinase subunit C family protein [Amycolatopsis alkalitolerans]|uniref:5-oxoprolinase/urea amidolyase family protein n=1 Tax=Amycolatopsis alkalitolerans TaxID=2547244 RepID=A0A5C4MA59_9PSEU|nr:5-oxoprolinase/urea amidolyase family protein [Amycolatopsis alkalitolerans]TNC29099.1 5-oxoprolinase/urea amidolyase family protein [Amycolatopsis alkalitolerans]